MCSHDRCDRVDHIGQEAMVALVFDMRRRWPALLALLLAFCAVAGGCSSNKNKNKKAANAGTPVAAGTPTPQQLLDEATRNTEALKAFHFTLTHENGETPIANGISMRKADGDFLSPDRFKATINGAIRGFAVDAKVINVGDNVWLQAITPNYQKLENGVSASQILDPNNGVLKALKGVRNPQYAGTDKINGTDMTVIGGSIDAGDLTALDSQAQQGKPVNGRVWIGNDDHRVYRLRIDGPLNDQEPGNIARQLDLSQFNENVSIEPPS
jgi:hypothetical protein